MEAIAMNFAQKSRIRLVGALLVSLTLMTAAIAKNGNESKIDARADSVLKAMSAYMSTLTQFSVYSQRSTEAVLKSGPKVQFLNSGYLYIQRPDKLRADYHGDPMSPESVTTAEKRMPIDASLYYNGTSLILYKKNYPTYFWASVPAVLDSTITYAWDCLHLEAPAADLLMKNNYGVLMDGVTSGMYLGIASIDSVACYQLVFRKPDVDWQIWVDTGAAPLPHRYVITSNDIKGEPEFIVTFSQWNTKGPFPESLFTFTPPSGVTKTELKPDCKKERPR